MPVKNIGKPRVSQIDFNVAPVEPFARAQKEVLGDDHAYPMIAYGTMKKSAAWKLYAKSQNVPFEIANEVSRQIDKYEKALKHADEDDKDDIHVEDYIEPQYQKIYAGSKDYNGLISSWSIAPCSYLLYQGSIRREIGLVRIKDNLCCNMDGHWAEEAHFLKNDLLKVSVVELIYRSYQRAGMEPPSVTELLRWCPPDSNAWEMYAKSCTLGLNQVEKAGTSARVATYKPTNISELCAFVAAIRPGFKSMYKTFESRTPFSYGVKAIDDLMQTEEMPNSFCLYQEQEMAALNFSGIDMSDCYTAIKNIAKKRVEKVLAYKETFVDGFREAIIREGKPRAEAEDLSHDFWRIIEDSSSYSFNASHSYCVSVDSLYSAWLKANHPYEFYETLLRIYEAKGKKDKMTEAKDEAERYFDIKFPPFRFGQDNRSIVADIEHGAITNAMSSIKGFGKLVGEVMYECAQEGYTDFIDILRFCDQRSIKTTTIQKLVNIDYFQEFGNIPTLSRLCDIWDYFRQGSAKSIKKEKLDDDMASIIARYATDKGKNGNELKSYSITDMDGLLRELERRVKELNLPELPYKIRVANQLDILGYVDLTTSKEEDRRKLLVLDKYELPDRFKGGIWKVKLKTKSIGSGKTSSLDVSPKVLASQPLKPGDIIYCADLVKDKKGYWQLLDYKILA